MLSQMIQGAGLSEALTQSPLLAFGVLFGAGLVTSLTPCVYPMIPITASVLAGTVGQDAPRSRVVGLTLTYALGLALLYAMLGLLAGMAGPNTKILPGHGVVSTRADVIEFRDMVIAVADRVEALVAQGRSYDEVAAADPTREFRAKWGDPERFLTAVYAELGGEQ